MKKKICSFLLCGFLILSLSGCGNDPNTNNSNQARGTNNKNEFNAETIEKNISITGSAEAEDGTLVAIVKNNNKESVSLEVEAVFYDENGDSVGSDTNYLSIYNNQEMACNFYNTPSDYSNYEINIKAEDNYYNNYSNQVDIKDNNTGEQITVQVTNNAGEDIEYVDTAVVFYRDGKIVGYDEDYSDDLRDEKTATFNINYPYNENYYDVTFDEYKVYVSAYSLSL